MRPVQLLKTPAGESVLDFGQNMVGWVRLKVRGPAGTTVTLRHAEVLDKEGNFYTANLRAAKQRVSYVLKGDGEEAYEPRFTFQGFRYVAVEGYPGEPTLDRLTGVVVHSDMPVTGHFETSSPMLNQLQRNIVWGQKGNFLDVPTDCPQRDERLGWTGDAQVFARTASFNMDVAGFFAKWLRDVAADQHENGSVPFVVPDVLSQGGQFSGGSAAWADAAVIVPWTMYLSYGDTRVLETQYPSMKAWVEYMRRQAGDGHLWTTGFHFGDWLAFATTRSDYPGATTGKDLIATAFFAHSTDLLQRTASVLGKNDEAADYLKLLARIKQAFVKEFVTASGRVGENTQTAYALALQFDLLPEDLRAEAARRLAAEVRSRGHLTTGFVGTPYLCHVLGRYGHLDVAYDLLNRQEYPSWLYPVKQGATTIWERWDGLKPDGAFQDPGMNSFNHYAYGAIGEWMYRVVAGLEIDLVGARLQTRAHPTAARRPSDLGPGSPRDALRRGQVGVGGRGGQARGLGRGCPEHPRHDPPSRSYPRRGARRRPGRGLGARRAASASGKRFRPDRSRLGALLLQLPGAGAGEEAAGARGLPRGPAPRSPARQPRRPSRPRPLRARLVAEPAARVAQDDPSPACGLRHRRALPGPPEDARRGASRHRGVGRSARRVKETTT